MYIEIKESRGRSRQSGGIGSRWKILHGILQREAIICCHVTGMCTLWHKTDSCAASFWYFKSFMTFFSIAWPRAKLSREYDFRDIPTMYICIVELYTKTDEFLEERLLEAIASGRSIYIYNA